MKPAEIRWTENERLGTDLDSAHQHVCKLEAAEARIAELEARYTASQDYQRELLKHIALDNRLAGAVERALDAWAENREAPLEEMWRLEEALDAYLSKFKKLRESKDEEV